MLTHTAFTVAALTMAAARPDGFTATDLATATGRSRSACQRCLARLVDAGALIATPATPRRVQSPGRSPLVYWQAGG